MFSLTYLSLLLGIACGFCFVKMGGSLRGQGPTPDADEQGAKVFRKGCAFSSYGQAAAISSLAKFILESGQLPISAMETPYYGKSWAPGVWGWVELPRWEPVIL